VESGKLIETVLVLGFIFGTGVTIAVSVAWFEYRTRTRALDVLRVYAERGEEAPASVMQALVHVSGRPPYTPPKAPTRANHLAHAAGNASLAAGLFGLAWWRMSAFGEHGTGIVVALLAALFFAGGLAARLVGAYYAPDR